MPEAIHIIVFGEVQGVFFRAGVQEQARGLGLSGWVRNRGDGAVELLAEGGRAALEGLLEWCYHGPAGAKVSEIEYGWVEPSGSFKDFRVGRD